MKLNGKTFKVVFAFVIVIVALFWAVDSVRSRSYTGTNLKFGVGNGTVTMTNPAKEAVLVQLVDPGSRPFSVSSTIEGVTGSSIRQKNDNNKNIQLFEFELPPGVSEFTVLRGTNVGFASDASTQLEAIVQPLSEGEVRSTVLVAMVIVLGTFFYLSRATGHRWINTLRGKETPVQEPKGSLSTLKSNPIRAFGDNRADISE
jgi:preprotein translocase subunit SecE